MRRVPVTGIMARRHDLLVWLSCGDAAGEVERHAARTRFFRRTGPDGHPDVRLSRTSSRRNADDKGPPVSRGPERFSEPANPQSMSERVTSQS